MSEVSIEITLMDDDKSFESAIFTEDEGSNQGIITEVNLQSADMMKHLGLSDEGTDVSLYENDFKSGSEESITLFDKASQNEKDEEDLKENKYVVENVKDGDYCVMPISLNYMMESDRSDTFSEQLSIVSRDKYSRRPCFSDLSNKVLIIEKKFVKLIRASADINTRNCLVFVVDHYVLEQIKNNEYNLDNLQYDIAKAIGIKPQHLKITNVINHFKKSNEDFTKIRLTSMRYPMEHKYNGFSNVPAKINFIQVKTQALEPIEVFIENFSRGIRWLGGFRNSKTGILYCNASIQTTPSKSCGRYANILISKNTQTHLPFKDKGINMLVDQSTQMWKTDHYIPTDTDVIVSPGIFKEYSESGKLEAAIIIQKHWRGMKVRKYELPKVIEDRIREEIFLKEMGALSDQELIDTNHLSAKLLNMVFPYKREHFYKVHNILFKFKQDLKKKLPEIKLDVAKKRYNFELMEKEIAELKSIQKQKILARNDTRDRKFLDFSSTPTIKYKSDKNCIYLVENTAITRCKQFKELFILFHRENVSITQRIEVILLFRDLMESVEDFEMKDELIELLNRECILLSTGVPSKYLKMLRKRSELIAANFIRSFETPDRLQDSKPPALQQIVRCKSCSKFKRIYDFDLALNQKTIQKCKSCLHKLQFSHTTLDFSYFETLLKYIRKDEYSTKCANPYLALIQPKGLQYIVIKIWGGQSIISYESVLTRLRLPRWDNREPWTPWNCILLTEEEEKQHITIENVYEFYSSSLCNIVKLKHLRTIKEFERIFEVQNLMRSRWCQLPNSEWKINKTRLMRAFTQAGESFFIPPPHKNI